MYSTIGSVFTLSLIICSANCEDRVMDIPLEEYKSIINNRCIAEVNFTSCRQLRRELYVSVKIRTKTSDIINAECCLYRQYLDCLDDSLYSAGCKKEVFLDVTAPVYDHFYNFETKCPSYHKSSWTVAWFCPWPWYVWTLTAISLNVLLVLMAYWLCVTVLRDKK